MNAKNSLFNLLISLAILMLAGAMAVANDNASSPVHQTRQDSGGGGGVSGKLPTTISKQPWTVALVDSGASNAFDGQFCGGTLIDPQWVVTAAHCVEDLAAGNVDVLTGQTFLSAADGERVSVHAIYIHPAWNSVLTDNDIALLKLSSPVSAGTPIAPVSSGATLTSPDSVGVVTGWGLIPEQGNIMPDQLQEVYVPIASQGDCNYLMGGVSDSMFCAGNSGGGADSCEGDSGGPLVVPDSSGGWALAGIVSWGGEQCGAAGSYGVYTDVADFVGWIEATTTGQTSETISDAGTTADPNFPSNVIETCSYIPDTNEWKCDSAASPQEGGVEDGNLYDYENYSDEQWYTDPSWNNEWYEEDGQYEGESWYSEDQYYWEPYYDDNESYRDQDWYSEDSYYWEPDYSNNESYSDQDWHSEESHYWEPDYSNNESYWDGDNGYYEEDCTFEEYYLEETLE